MNRLSRSLHSLTSKYNASISKPQQSDSAGSNHTNPSILFLYMHPSRTKHHHPFPPSRIIPTSRQPLSPTSQILPKPLPPNNNRPTILQTKNHSRPAILTRIPPGMHRRTLHHHVPPTHNLHFAGVEDRFDGAFEHDAVVERLRAVHHARVLGGEVDVAEDCAARAYEACLPYIC